MPKGWTLSDLSPESRERNKAALESAGVAETPKPNKYGAVPTEYGGRRYHSKREADYAADLDVRQLRGEITGYLVQVPFWLTGGVKYVADFLVVYPDGRLRLIDVKGVETDVFRIKQRLMAAEYAWLKLEVVR